MPAETSAVTAYRFEHVSWGDPRAVALRERMDDEMSVRYSRPGAPLNDLVMRALTVDPATVRATVLVLDADGTPIGHAALRILRGDWEVKRVIVTGDQRGRGVGSALMRELENIVRSAAPDARRIILQTGDRQPEAVALYTHLGYTPIPTYEPYVEAIPNSHCFELLLR